MKKISLKDISNSLNISKTTISLVLNGRGDEKRVSKETQESIIKFAKENNYKANQIARGLSLGKSNMIGLIVPNISDVFYARIASRIERVAEHSNFNVIFSSTRENQKRESDLIQSMLHRQVDGLIIASCQKNSKDILRLKRDNFPFVLFDRHYPEIETNYVGVDNNGGISLGVEQLNKFGRKRIGFITIKAGLEPIRQRLEGYVSAMKDLDLEIEENFIHEIGVDSIESDMAIAINKMVQFPTKIEGIVFATHNLTAQGIRELRRLNLRIPMDVAIFSFGQMPSFDLVDPPITSVIQPTDEIGDRSVELLFRAMNGELKGNESIILKTNFILRKSCGTI